MLNKDVLAAVHAHLDDIKRIASTDGAPNTMSRDNLEGMDEAAKLSVFVKPDESFYLREKITKNKEKKIARGKFIKSCGVVASGRSRCQLESDSNSSSSSEDEGEVAILDDSD